MSSRFLPRMMAVWLLFTAVLGVPCASALEYRFEGVVTAAVAGNYGVAAGDRFSGYLRYDPEQLSPFGWSGGAVIEFHGDQPAPSVIFNSFGASLYVGEGSLYLVGNPYDFFGSLYLQLSSGGAVVGGDLSLNSEPGKNNGSIQGIIQVPEVGATLGLLGFGAVVVLAGRRWLAGFGRG